MPSKPRNQKTGSPTTGQPSGKLPHRPPPVDLQKWGDAMVDRMVKNLNHNVLKDNPEPLSSTILLKRDIEFQFMAFPEVVRPETVTAALKTLSLRGWQIADRWALGSPKKVKQMEAAGTLIPRLEEQQKLEAKIISAARVAGSMGDTPDSEILAMREIPLLPSDGDGSDKPESEELLTEGYDTMSELVHILSEPFNGAEQGTLNAALGLKFPTGTNRKFSPYGLAFVTKLGKLDPLLALSYVPAKQTGQPVFDPELCDALHGRFPWKNATMAEKQAAINEAWED